MEIKDIDIRENEEFLTAPSYAEGQLAETTKAWLRQIHTFEMLAPEVEQDLGRKAHNGDKGAHDTLFNHNLRFVVMVARKYRSLLASGALSLDLDDLIQEGAIGLADAIKDYNPEAGTRLSTFAVPRIRMAIHRALDNFGRVIRIPTHVGEGIRALQGVQARLSVTLGREPTLEEVYEAMGQRYSLETLRSWEGYARLGLLADFDAPIGDGDDGETLGQRVADPEDKAPIDQFLDDQRAQALKEELDKMSEKDRMIFTLRLAGADYPEIAARLFTAGIKNPKGKCLSRQCIQNKLVSITRRLTVAMRRRGLAELAD